mgnify:FL=1
MCSSDLQLVDRYGQLNDRFLKLEYLEGITPKKGPTIEEIKKVKGSIVTNWNEILKWCIERKIDDKIEELQIILKKGKRVDA